ncbi:MAG: VIT1/CCC1 family protein, partial [Nitrososphaerota archaeon]
MEFQRFCYSEFRDYMVYLALLRSERDPNRKEILKRIASQEYEHYLFWRKLSGECITKISRIHIYTILLVRIIFGLTFTLKLLEGHESKTITEYRKVMEKFVEDEHRRELEMLIQDEIEHERYFMNQIDEKILRYTGFIVLGLADSIIEITGVYAGFLGATSSTTVAGIAGLLVGFAASISMAAASYLQAKAQESMK